MSDSLTCMVSTALVTGIVQALATSISKLHELHARWKQADFMFINLIAQLSALKAVLTKLEVWMDTNRGEERGVHHQLIMDLEAIIKCCKILAHKIDCEISELYINADNALRYESKIKLILKNGTLEELQKMVDRQTNALTTLLTACNFNFLYSQKNLLERSTTRKMIQSVKDDTSSLYAQRGSVTLQSGASWYTDTLSKISKTFEFDRELFSSKVYEKVLKNSLKDTVNALRRQATPTFRMPQISIDSPEDIRERKRLEALDHKIEWELRQRQKSQIWKVVVLGGNDCARLFLNKEKIRPRNEFTTEELQKYKRAIRDNIWRIVHDVEVMLDEAIVKMDGKTGELAQRLSRELRDGRFYTANFSAVAVKALQEVLACQQLWKTLVKSAQPRISISAKYFVQEIERIMDENYIPTTTDILNIKGKEPRSRTYKVTKSKGPVDVVDISGQSWSEREQWIYHLCSANIIVYCIDLSTYNELDPKNSNQNRLQESIDLFGMVADSQWCYKPSFLLLFFNFTSFRRKLKISPLSNYFTAYEGPPDAYEAYEYLLEQFKISTVRGHGKLSALCCKTSDFTAFQNEAWGNIQETFVQQSMRASGLC